MVRAALVATLLLLPLAIVQPASGIASEEAHLPIAILGDVGPSGLILGYDENGDPIYNPSSGVRSGRGSADDPFVISGWRIDGAPLGAGSVLALDEFTEFLIGERGPDTRDVGTAVRIEGTRAYLRVAENVLAGATPFRLVDVQNVIVEGNTITAGSELAQIARDADDDAESAAPIWIPPSQFLPLAKGIEVFGASDVVLRANAVQGASIPIAVKDSQRILIDSNVVHASPAETGDVIGVSVAESSGIAIIRTTFEGTDSDYNYLIFVIDSDAVEITGHTTLSPHRDTTLLRVTNGRIHNNTLGGIISASSSSAITIEHNAVRPPSWISYGIHVDISTDVTVLRNDVSASAHSAGITQSTGVVMRGNNLVSYGAPPSVGLILSSSQADLRDNWWGCPEGALTYPFGNACAYISVSSDSSLVYGSWLTSPNPAAGPQGGA